MAEENSKNNGAESSARDLAEYQAKLSKLMFEDSPAIFANYSIEHARCIIRTFFESAKNSVSVLAGDFGNDFYKQPDIRYALKRAVANGALVRIISLNGNADSMNTVIQFRDELNKMRCGAVEVKFGVVRPGARVKHYMIVDDKRYRLEEVHSAEKGSPVHAEVCCNGPGKAAELNLSFNNVWSRLRDLPA
ncbi:MAG: hypothetical protein J6V72_19870 [Kiritimatiellae bacterium]|nr:hypothetical protein [Kiritimatiellia bacterium]